MTSEQLAERLRERIRGTLKPLAKLYAIGTTPMTWECVKDTLPLGMSLDVSSLLNRSWCYLQGTPTQTGTYKFTLRASNSNGYHDREFTVIITDNEKELERLQEEESANQNQTSGQTPGNSAGNQTTSNTSGSSGGGGGGCEALPSVACIMFAGIALSLVRKNHR